MWDSQDVNEDIQLLTTHLKRCLKDTFLKINFIDGSNIETFYGKGISTPGLPPYNIPNYMQETFNPIILIYHEEDRRPSLAGIKFGRRPFKNPKKPVAIITYDNGEKNFNLHFNIDATFFQITTLLSFILKHTEKIILKDLFGHYIDSVRVSPIGALQKKECFCFGDFFYRDALIKALAYIDKTICKISETCIQNEYIFCLDLNRSYEPDFD